MAKLTLADFPFVEEAIAPEVLAIWKKRGGLPIFQVKRRMPSGATVSVLVTIEAPSHDPTRFEIHAAVMAWLGANYRVPEVEEVLTALKATGRIQWRTYWKPAEGCVHAYLPATIEEIQKVKQFLGTS